MYLMLAFFAGGVSAWAVQGISKYWYPGFFLNEWYPGFFLSKVINPHTSTDIYESGAAYNYISPLLSCSDTEMSAVGYTTTKAIENKVGDYIEEQKQKGALADAAVYYRDLLGGPWALVNRSLMSTPGSLLKVPLALSIYSHADGSAGFLDKQVAYAGPDLNTKEVFTAPEAAAPGTEYPVSALLKYSLAYSDNNATEALFKQLSDKEIARSFSDLGIDTAGLYKNNFVLDVRTYASFFRILYNATYLNRADSEAMLALLAQSSFKQGIVAGVPKNIAVAHKFGEAEFADGAAQLHDCGIVYKPKNPYLLCIMTHGTDPQKLAGAIAGISKIVYDTIKE